MRLIFAVVPQKAHIDLMKKCNVRHILISYAFIKKVDRFIRLIGDYRPDSITLDSGAFSVWSKGQTIDIERYIAFAKELRHRLDPQIQLNVVNLDVLPGKIGETPTDEQREHSAVEGYDNMLRLEAAGLKVIHVYHQHEDLKWLDKIRSHTDYMGISPANDCSMKQKLAFMDSVYAKIRASIKTHGFAVTSTEQLYRYPLYSADSSSWSVAARYGRIPVFRDDMTMASVIYKNKKHVTENWKYLKEIGIEKLSADNWFDRTELSIRSFQKLEKMVTELWAKRGVTWDD